LPNQRKNIPAELSKTIKSHYETLQFFSKKFYVLQTGVYWTEASSDNQTNC